MFHRFRWTRIAGYRNELTAEYEPVQPFFLVALAEEASCKTFLDVGANIGAYSLFATLIPTVERCIAFEANPSAARELRKNVDLNGADIDILEVAVSDKAGELSFGVTSEYAGNNAVVETSIHDSAIFGRRIAVPAITLDSLLPLPEPIGLKIDVEGHEPNVLAGATRLLTCKCVIQIENYDCAATDAELRRAGYFHLTTIGPDRYYSNIDALRDRTIAIYERAMQKLIASNHSAPKPLVISRGNFSLQVRGASAVVLRRLMRR